MTQKYLTGEAFCRLSAVFIVLLFVFIGTSNSAAQAAQLQPQIGEDAVSTHKKGLGTACYGTTWSGKDADYQILNIKNCGNKPAWIAKDYYDHTNFSKGYCVAPGKTITVDRAGRAGPLRIGSSVYAQYCKKSAIGTSQWLPNNAVNWGAHSLYG